MRVWAVGIVLLLACSRTNRDASSDCEVVRTDPGTAAAKLAQKYPAAPVKVAEIIEGCVAPSGPPCERLAKIVAAIPGLMPAGSPAVTAPTQVAELCGGMPPEMQRCMLPSYALAHLDECAKIREKIAASAVGPIEIKPRTGSPPSGGSTPPCDELRIEITSAEVTVRRDAVKSLARTAGKTDIDALRTLLAELASRCVGEATIASTDDVVYQEVIAIMDTAVAAGFRAIGLDTPGAPTGKPADKPADKPTDQPADRPRPASASDSLSSAPVIVVTRQAVSIANVEISPLDADATEPVATALAKTRTADPKLQDLVILQADGSTPMRTIKQVIAGGRRAGFDNILFAVKNK
jgi:biopolymer transport protein ExbD